MAQAWLDRYECDRDGELPPVCMKCGADAEHYVKRTFSWCPPWVIILIVAGVLIWVILSIVLTKTMKVFVPLCEEHKNYFGRRKMVGSVVVLAGLGVMFAGIGVAVAFADKWNDLGGYFVCGGVVVFLIALIAGSIVMSQGIKPTGITDDDIKLSGVHEEFAEALKDQRRAKKLARDKRRAERGDDEEDRRPRRRRRDDDEYDD